MKNGPINVPLETQMYARYPNQQWAVSAARTSDPNSATSEFSIMLGDNRCGLPSLHPSTPPPLHPSTPPPLTFSQQMARARRLRCSRLQCFR